MDESLALADGSVGARSSRGGGTSASLSSSVTSGAGNGKVRVDASGEEARLARMAQRTPLMRAAAAGNVEWLRQLIADGADLFAIDERSRRAIDWARSSAHGAETGRLLSEAMEREMEMDRRQAERDAEIAHFKNAVLRNVEYQEKVLRAIKARNATALADLARSIKLTPDDVVRNLERLRELLAHRDVRAEAAGAPQPPPSAFDARVLAGGSALVVPRATESPVTMWPVRAPKDRRIGMPVPIGDSMSETTFALNVQTRDGWTALAVAAVEDDVPAVRALLANRAELDVETRLRHTALTWAASCGHTEVVRELMKHGADLTRITSEGKSALIHAAAKGRTETTLYIVETLVNLALTPPGGAEAAFASAEAAAKEMAKHKVEKSEEAAETAMGATYIPKAAVVDSLEMFRECLYWRDNSGHTALDFSEQLGHEQVSALLRHCEDRLRHRQILMREAYDASVKRPCANKCGWWGTRERKKTHERDECPLNEIPCVLKCGKLVVRQEMTEHTRSLCVKREVTCRFAEEGCTAILREDMMEAHLKHLCAFRPMECPRFCGKHIRADELHSHLDKRCRLRKLRCTCGLDIEAWDFIRHQQKDCSRRMVACNSVDWRLYTADGKRIEPDFEPRELAKDCVPDMYDEVGRIVGTGEGTAEFALPPRQQVAPEERIGGNPGRVIGCGAILPFDEMQVHLSESCPNRHIPCRFCGVPAAPADRRFLHESRYCAKRHVECRWGCGAVVRAEDIEEHEVNACLIRPHRCELGCGVPVRWVDRHWHQKQGIDGECRRGPAHCLYDLVGKRVRIRRVLPRIETPYAGQKHLDERGEEWRIPRMATFEKPLMEGENNWVDRRPRTPPPEKEYDAYDDFVYGVSKLPFEAGGGGASQGAGSDTRSDGSDSSDAEGLAESKSQPTDTKDADAAATGGDSAPSSSVAAAAAPAVEVLEADDESLYRRGITDKTICSAFMDPPLMSHSESTTMTSWVVCIVTQFDPDSRRHKLRVEPRSDKADGASEGDASPKAASRDAGVADEHDADFSPRDAPGERSGTAAAQGPGSNEGEGDDESEAEDEPIEVILTEEQLIEGNTAGFVWVDLSEGWQLEAAYKNDPFVCGEVERGRMDTHLADECGLRRVTCHLCRGTLRAKYLEFHLTERCEFGVVECSRGCGIPSLLRKDRWHHEENECKNRFVTCRCNETMPLPDLTRHLLHSCSLRMMRCVFGCNAIIPAYLKRKHEEEVCVKRDVLCEICNRHVWAERLRHHQANECTHRIVECPNSCGMELDASLVPDHAANACPARLVMCPLGCGHRYRAEVLKTHKELECTLRRVACDLGCGEMLQYREKEAHEMFACTYRLHLCRWGCGEELQQRHLVDHEEKTCYRRPLACPRGCGTVMWHSDLDAHLTWCLRQLACCGSVGTEFEIDMIEGFADIEGAREYLRLQHKIASAPEKPDSDASVESSSDSGEDGIQLMRRAGKLEKRKKRQAAAQAAAAGAGGPHVPPEFADSDNEDATAYDFMDDEEFDAVTFAVAQSGIGPLPPPNSLGSPVKLLDGEAEDALMTSRSAARIKHYRELRHKARAAKWAKRVRKEGPHLLSVLQARGDDDLARTVMRDLRVAQRRRVRAEKRAAFRASRKDVTGSLDERDLWCCRELCDWIYVPALPDASNAATAMRPGSELQPVNPKLPVEIAYMEKGKLVPVTNTEDVRETQVGRRGALAAPAEATLSRLEVHHDDEKTHPNIAVLAPGKGLLRICPKHGDNPLVRAARYGDKKRVEVLLPFLALPAVVVETRNGTTALHVACRWGHLPVIEELVTKGCDVNHETSRGMTPLLEACRGGHMNVVQYLVSRDVDVRYKSRRLSIDAAELCRRLGGVARQEIEEWLRDRTKLEDTQRDLFIAISTADTSTIASIVKGGEPFEFNHRGVLHRRIKALEQRIESLEDRKKGLAKIAIARNRHLAEAEEEYGPGSKDYPGDDMPKHYKIVVCEKQLQATQKELSGVLHELKVSNSELKTAKRAFWVARVLAHRAISGYTAMDWAAANGEVIALRTMVEHGGNPNVGDDVLVSSAQLIVQAFRGYQWRISEKRKSIKSMIERFGGDAAEWIALRKCVAERRRLRCSARVPYLEACFNGEEEAMHFLKISGASRACTSYVVPLGPVPRPYCRHNPDTYIAGNVMHSERAAKPLSLIDTAKEGLAQQGCRQLAVGRGWRPLEKSRHALMLQFVIDEQHDIDFGAERSVGTIMARRAQRRGAEEQRRLEAELVEGLRVWDWEKVLTLVEDGISAETETPEGHNVLTLAAQIEAFVTIDFLRELKGDTYEAPNIEITDVAYFDKGGVWVGGHDPRPLTPEELAERGNDPNATALGVPKALRDAQELENRRREARRERKRRAAEAAARAEERRRAAAIEAGWDPDNIPDTFEAPPLALEDEAGAAGEDSDAYAEDREDEARPHSAVTFAGEVVEYGADGSVDLPSEAAVADTPRRRDGDADAVRGDELAVRPRASSSADDGTRPDTALTVASGAVGLPADRRTGGKKAADGDRARPSSEGGRSWAQSRVTRKTSDADAADEDAEQDKALALDTRPRHLEWRKREPTQVLVIAVLLDRREYRPSPNRETTAGHTPLTRAAEYGRTHTIATLLARGANVNYVTSDGTRAARRQSQRLRIQTHPHAVAGTTAIMRAARRHRRDVAKMLCEVCLHRRRVRAFRLRRGCLLTRMPHELQLQCGADLFIKDKSGRDALDWATRDISSEPLRVLTANRFRV